MRRVMGIMVIAGMLLVWGHAASAEVVGQKLSETSAFKQYVDTGKTLQDKIAQQDKEIESSRRALSGYNDNPLLMVLPMNALGPIFAKCKIFIYMFLLLSMATMVLYIIYLVLRNPMKWKMMTEWRVIGVLWNKLMHRNGIIGLLFLAAVFLPGQSFAKTNVLQDIKMYYAGSEFEKGYLLCKYSKGPISLGYTAVNGVPVLSKPESGFDRAYDVVAHLRGLGLNVNADEFVSLYEAAKNDADRTRCFSLLAMADKDMAQEAALQIVGVICSQNARLDASIGHFKGLLAAFADSNNRLLANGLVKEFLEKGVGRVKDLEDLDNLVELASANGAFEIIQDRTDKVLKGVPSRLSFSDSVYAARIYFKLDKNKSREYFNQIRFDFREFTKSETISNKILGLMRDLSGVAAFLPLYERDALYKALQQQPNDLRVDITGMFDKVDPTLAAVAYGSIGSDYKDMIFRNPQSLIAFATLTDKYKQDKALEFLSALKRAVVEVDTTYTKATLLQAVAALKQSPPAFIESVLTYDMSTECRFNRNNPLILSLIDELTREQISAFESYFSKKTALSEGILRILFTKDKGAFNKLLAQVFAEDPKRLANVSFPNDILDLKLLAPAFSDKTMKEFSTLPAAIFIANQELSKPNPDVKLTRRAIIPFLDSLFKGFLSEDEKSLSEEGALTTLIMLSLFEKPGAAPFADEAFVLNRLVTDYFSGAIKNGHTTMNAAIAAREKNLAAAEGGLADLRSVKALLNFLVFYCVFLGVYLLVGSILSFFYGCNALVPGKNFSLMNWWFHSAEAKGKFAMATILLLLPGMIQVIFFQFLRGLIARETVTPDWQTCVGVLERGYGPKAQPAPENNS